MRTISCGLICGLVLGLFLDRPVRAVGSASNAQLASAANFLAEEFALLQAEDVVFLASKRPEKRSEAPALIDVIPGERFEEWGVRTVAEVLDLLAGFDTQYSGSLEDQTISARGFDGLAKFPLILVDGVPIPRTSFIRLYDHRLDLAQVERLEVMRSPTGVTWGANTLLGAINIVTKDGRSQDGLKATVAGGNLHTQNYHVSYGNQVREGAFRDMLIYAGGSFYSGSPKSVDEPFQVLSTFPMVISDTLLGEDGETRDGYSTNLAGKVNWKGWVLEANHYRNDVENNASSTIPGRLPDGDENSLQEYFTILALNYDSNVSSSLRGSAFHLFGKAYYFNFDWNQRSGEFSLPPATLVAAYSTKEAREEATGVEANLEWMQSNYFQLLAGTSAVLESLTDGRGSNVDKFGTPTDGVTPTSDNVTASVYTQGTIKPVSPVRIDTGIRVNMTNEFEDSVVLFGATSYRLATHTHLRAIYSEGTENPRFIEFFGEPAGVTPFLPNPDLKSTKSRSLTIGVSTELIPHTMLECNASRVRIYDESELTTVFDNIGNPFPQIVTSSEDRYINTIEASGKLRADDGSYLSANYTFNDIERSEDFTITTPRSRFNLIAHKKFKNGFWGTAIAQWMSERLFTFTVSENNSGFVPLEVDPKIAISLGGGANYDRFHFSVFGHNIFDPDHGEKYSVLQGRRVVGRVSFNF